jgi:uncharacterized protein
VGKSNVFTQIEKIAKKYFKKAHKSHDFSHVKRVYNLCLKIGKKEKADMEILKIATLLHDIGREEEDKKKGKICHAEYGAILAEKILKDLNFPQEKILKISHCIKAHRYRNETKPESIEAKVLFDADKLDSIGAIGIGRAFLFAFEVGANLHNSENIKISETQPYTKEDTAYREFEVKLKNVSSRMLTSEGKKLARERHEFMVEFFDRLNKEIEGKL